MPTTSKNRKMTKVIKSEKRNTALKEKWDAACAAISTHWDERKIIWDEYEAKAHALREERDNLFSQWDKAHKVLDKKEEKAFKSYMSALSSPND